MQLKGKGKKYFVFLGIKESNQMLGLETITAVNFTTVVVAPQPREREK